MTARLLAILALVLLAAAAAAPAQSERPAAMVLDIDGPIGPATSGFVVRGLARAAASNAAVVVLRMDTPGGLDTSMREIIRAILASPVPVAAFVAPSGARAASAGTYIIYASHVAAMAPGTNLGAATPVQIGGTGAPGGGQPEEPGKQGDPGGRRPGLEEKAVNDAVAYIRSLAQMRGRNVEWAEKAVREAASLPAEEALQQHVIDLITPDVPALLARIDGRTVRLADREVTLKTDGAEVVAIESTVAHRHPRGGTGLVGPGVAGGICILLALYAFHVLPIDYTGLALMMLGIGLMVAEAFIGAFGVIGVGGIAAFVIGTVMLMRDDVPEPIDESSRLDRPGGEPGLHGAVGVRHPGAAAAGGLRPRADGGQRRPGAGLERWRRKGAGARRGLAGAGCDAAADGSTGSGQAHRGPHPRRRTGGCGDALRWNWRSAESGSGWRSWW